MDVFDIHGKCLIFSKIENPALKDYMRFQFRDFVVDERAASGRGARLEISGWGEAGRSVLASCSGPSFAIELNQERSRHLHLRVRGKTPKMLFNKFLVIALRFLLGDEGFYICHGAVIGDRQFGEVYFGSGGAGKTSVVVRKFFNSQGKQFIYSDDYCFVSEDWQLLGFPRYFAVKVNNFKLFSAQLSRWEKAKYEIWANKFVERILRRLPSRLGHAPVKHVQNFGYPKGMQPAEVEIRRFYLLGNYGRQKIAEFIMSVNYREFSADFCDGEHSGHWRIRISDDARMRLRALIEKETAMWKKFAASGRVSEEFRDDS